MFFLLLPLGTTRGGGDAANEAFIDFTFDGNH